ncbi:hypothetical protein M3J09_001530 [Ascochyta lentis]
MHRCVSSAFDVLTDLDFYRTSSRTIDSPHSYRSDYRDA